MVKSCDIIVIGAGIAGASTAAEMATSASVVLLEMENAAGYHTTGRSAATFIPSYGPPVIRALTRASEAFFRTPPDGFTESTLIDKRGELMLARAGDEQFIEQACNDGLTEISLPEAKQMVRQLKTEEFVAALYDHKAEDLDVDALHQGYLKAFRARGGSIVLGAQALSIIRRNSTWHVETPKGNFAAPLIVNAAGAWADTVARLAGAEPLGIQPKRRSAALISTPDEWQISKWPLVFGAGETFYFRPMGGKLMVSPADATVVEPHDAWADDMLIAESIEHLQNTIDIEVTRLDHTWGGLRTFAPDGDPLVGHDPIVQGFFWLAGQGGYGIQTAPAIAQVAACLVAGKSLPDALGASGITTQCLAPDRLPPHYG